MRHVRLLGLATTLISLVASLIYNIAITRKLSIDDLGLLTLLNAATAFSLLPNAVLSFVFPRIAARDSGLSMRASAEVSALFFSASAAMTAGYLAITWGEMGPRAPLVLAAALASELVTYTYSVAGSVLIVKDRGRFVFSNLAQAAAKLIAVPALWLLKWSIEAVLWSSVAITAAPAAYSLVYAMRYAAPGAFKRYLRDVVNAAWVPLLGYAINSFRSLDASIIGLFGALGQLGVWFTLFILSKPYGFSSVLMNITYGELLERGKSRVYEDLLVVLSVSTTISLSYIFFEPLFVNFLRPRDPQLISALLVPIALWSATNILGTLNQFISNVMQGVDKRDIEAEEIRARSYLGSLVLYAHLAELLFTVIYLASIAPLIYLFEKAGVELYAVQGVIVASLLGNIAAFLFRFTRAGGRLGGLIRLRWLTRDYLAPTAAASILLYVVSRVAELPLVPSAYVSLAEIALAVVATAAIYAAASYAISPNFRALSRLVARRLAILINI
ncbi:MAG: hypothetical protein TU35_002885 [Thermoproteus sp. AZ2]|uniref:Uncharacterized protein n=1 Tax=Thermoproteus sp. AZ2 TaxID=1609232 RepID=A0ACC6UZD5_9CREN